MCCVFFFKQKTAYEMRISDWSSDVCSSDLPQIVERRARNHLGDRAADDDVGGDFIDDVQAGEPVGVAFRLVDLRVDDHLALVERPHVAIAVGAERHVGIERAAGAIRSEEHTSELQSLMRISYDVFCL